VINHTVLLFKNTSLAMVIGVTELTYVTRDIENQTFRTFEAYTVATVGYGLLFVADGDGGAAGPPLSARVCEVICMFDFSRFCTITACCC
jgi:hypothetical protein